MWEGRNTMRLNAKTKRKTRKMEENEREKKVDSRNRKTAD